ncbi:MAG: right-handed parallel beta-helix repeat-containing protein [Candidatus Aenigmatarchaeota archaeon]
MKLNSYFILASFFVFIFLSNSAFASYMTVCSSGCDYTTLQDCLNAINGTSNGCEIKEGGLWTMNKDYYYADGIIIELNASHIILDCNGSSLEASAYTVHASSYSWKENITVKNCNFTTTSAGNLSIARFDYVSRLNFTNNSVMRLEIDHVNASIISSNTFPKPSFAYEYYRTNFGGVFENKDNIFENNAIYGGDGGIEIETFGNGGANNTIRNNTIEDVTIGLYLGGRNGTNYIYNNTIRNTSQMCAKIVGIDYSIENNTFEDCGTVSGPYEAYLSSYSPLQYNGNDYTNVLYYNSNQNKSVSVTEDNTNVSSIVTGENNFSLWLGTIGDDRFVIYVEEPESMSCSDLFNAYGGTCDFEQDGYWIANGYGQNYTLNQSPQVSVIPGYTDPAWLRYSSWYVQDYYPIVLYGSGNNITKNWIKDVNKKNNYSIYSDTNAQDRIWLNMLLSGGINITGTEPILCVGGEGNFYGEGSLGVPENDCGPASITAPTAGAYTGSITIQWTAQSSPEPVTYDVYAKNLATGEMTKLTETTSLSYLWNLSGYLGNYKAIIIPWISGSRINATWAESGILQLGQGTGGGNVTVTILTSITISLPVDTVNFGTMQLGQSDNTTDNSPPPFILQNDGSVPVNITINATQLWYSSLGSGTSSYYQFKTECNESSCVPDPDNDLVTSWTNIPINEQAILACSNLRFIDNQDTVKIHIKVTVPVDEPAGSKNSTVTFTASQA